MKAIRVLEYGDQLVFSDVPTPTIARNEILVKVKSTAVNHVDLVKASGTARQVLPIDLPWIPGHEFSGLVEQIGSDVAAYAPGDAVFGSSGGAYAEYLAVKPATIAKKPSNLSFEEAASVPVASQTAWQGIFTHGHLEKGQTILITQNRSFLVLKSGGHLISATQPVSQEEAAKHGVSGEMMRLAPSSEMLGKIAQLLEGGTIRPDVATVYALKDAAQAWKDVAGKLPGVHGLSPSESGAPRRKKHGKIVLRVS